MVCDAAKNKAMLMIIILVPKQRLSMKEARNCKFGFTSLPPSLFANAITGMDSENAASHCELLVISRTSSCAFARGDAEKAARPIKASSLSFNLSQRGHSCLLYTISLKEPAVEASPLSLAWQHRLADITTGGGPLINPASPTILTQFGRRKDTPRVQLSRAALGTR